MKTDPIEKVKPTILIVDDQIDNIEVLAIALEMQGYSITYALSGAETFQRLKAIQPDLILLDLFMPDMDGLQVCEKIKANSEYKDIPILFLTASHEEEHLISAFVKGAADYVTKPFKTAELFARVKTHIKLRKQALEIQRSRKKLDTIINHIQDGILVVDTQGVIQFANLASAQMFNKDLSELIGSEMSLPLVEKKNTEINIIKPDGELGKAEMTVGEAEWEGKPASIVSIISKPDVSA